MNLNRRIPSTFQGFARELVGFGVMICAEVTQPRAKLKGFSVERHILHKVSMSASIRDVHRRMSVVAEVNGESLYAAKAVNRAFPMTR
jgi:hypothetical protein